MHFFHARRQDLHNIRTRFGRPPQCVAVVCLAGGAEGQVTASAAVHSPRLVAGRQIGAPDNIFRPRINKLPPLPNDAAWMTALPAHGLQVHPVHAIDNDDPAGTPGSTLRCNPMSYSLPASGATATYGLPILPATGDAPAWGLVRHGGRFRLKKTVFRFSRFSLRACEVQHLVPALPPFGEK